MVTFDNTYARLPQAFFSPIQAPNSFTPSLIAFNDDLARELGLDFSDLSEAQKAKYFSACEFMPGSTPVAMAYAGHQFGHFNPQLGDGRAMLLGEFLSTGTQRFDVHLKGSGATVFSRRGDGKSAIGPVLREYIVSEGMHALGIPTTRTLCAVRTGELVQRQEVVPGAVQTRLGLSHIRVGTFQYFAYRGDLENLKILADYTIQRLYPGHSVFEFWRALAHKQMKLVAQWMGVGFIHGVMNTDNFSVSGESIDFGPCAFMDNFSQNKVFSSIDQQGRYAYQNQPKIAVWNLARLAECLIPLMEHAPEESQKLFEDELKQLHDVFLKEHLAIFCHKLGISRPETADAQLIQDWLTSLETKQLDFTLSFIDLERTLQGLPTFGDSLAPELVARLTERYRKEESCVDMAVALMKKTNPLTIPRNHKLEEAIRASETGDDGLFLEMIQVVRDPFTRRESLGAFQLSPKPAERVLQTFCGT